MIIIDSISKSFKKKRVLDQFSLKVDTNETIFLQGENGSGKSTLINLMASIIKPDRGNITINGYNIYKSHSYKLFTGFRLERPTYLNKLYPIEFLRLLRSFYSSRSISKEYGGELLEKFKIPPKARLIEDLSKGQKSKLAFISSIMHNPNYLILDEPFEGFDNKSLEAAIQLIINLKKGQDFTAIIATHIDVGQQCLNGRTVVINAIK